MKGYTKTKELIININGEPTKVNYYEPTHRERVLFGKLSWWYNDSGQTMRACDVVAINHYFMARNEEVTVKKYKLKPFEEESISFTVQDPKIIDASFEAVKKADKIIGFRVDMGDCIINNLSTFPVTKKCVKCDKDCPYIETANYECYECRSLKKL